MIHIGTVHLNGRTYSLELNRAENPEKYEDESLRAGARKTPKTGRFEVVPLNPSRRFLGARNANRRRAGQFPIEEPRRSSAIARREQGHTAPAQTRWQVDRERLVKAISAFLSWCFPVRGFRSSLQRVLYLSIEGPKPKYRKRLLLP